MSPAPGLPGMFNVNVSFNAGLQGEGPVMVISRITATRILPSALGPIESATFKIMNRVISDTTYKYFFGYVTANFLNGSFTDVFNRIFTSGEKWRIDLICAINADGPFTVGYDTTNGFESRGYVTLTLDPSLAIT